MSTDAMETVELRLEELELAALAEAQDGAKRDGAVRDGSARDGVRRGSLRRAETRVPIARITGTVPDPRARPDQPAIEAAPDRAVGRAAVTIDEPAVDEAAADKTTVDEAAATDVAAPVKVAVEALGEAAPAEGATADAPDEVGTVDAQAEAAAVDAKAAVEAKPADVATVPTAPDLAVASPPATDPAPPASPATDQPKPVEAKPETAEPVLAEPEQGEPDQAANGKEKSALVTAALTKPHPTGAALAPAATPPAITTPDRIAPLAKRTEALCAGAVDIFEVAAGLEADGINDAAAVALYGQPDVFALAEELYLRAPRRAENTKPADNPWRSRAVHHLLRGVLFGLPGLCYVAASRSLAASGAVAAIVLSLLLSWGASEALSYLGYVRLGQGDKPGAARVLRRGLGVALAVVLPVTLLAGWAFGAGPVGAAFAVGQGAYLLAATVVLVSGAERWLLAALVPSVAGSGYYLLSGAQATVPLVVWAAGATTALATLAVALVLTRRSGPASNRKVSRRDLMAAAPHAAFGMLAGGLLTFTTIVALIGPAGGRGPVLAGAVVTLPLSLSMGVAELLLFRYRRHTFALLLSSKRLIRFARRARFALAGVVVAYLVVLALIADAIAWVGHRTGSFAVTPRLFWTAVVLGGALFVALGLRSCGVTRVVLASCAATLLGEAAFWWASDRFGQPVDVITVQLVACTALFTVLLAYAGVVLGRATRHR